MKGTVSMEDSRLPPEAEMYQALLDKDSRYEGIFVAAIKTTGIFCRPSCSARKPLRQHVEYFATAREALAHGYRSCRRCHPMEPLGSTPSWIRELLEAIRAEPGGIYRDADLRHRGLDPVRVRRWFKTQHGMTFQAYLRCLRINRAFGQIRHKDPVIHTAYDNGFDSLSAFNEAFRNITGFKPSQSGSRSLVTVTRILSPLGPLLCGATDEGICLLEFTDRRMLQTQILRLRKAIGAEFLPGEHPLLDQLSEQLAAYFEGKRKNFDIPLQLAGTPFQEQVWKELLTIPYGQTRSYQEQAAAIGNLAAIRAVARANGDNRISILIPCHRVIGKDGSLTGYGGGLWRKQFLLKLEGSSDPSGQLQMPV
ncbi:MAG: methylated-DNA--[protein]-cysteine S-methyltransferase [Puniceicoccaceae bacterium]